MFTIKTVKNTIWFSLILQIITGLIPIPGLYIKLQEKDKILTDILLLETRQFIELFFMSGLPFQYLISKKWHHGIPRLVHYYSHLFIVYNNVYEISRAKRKRITK